MLKEEEGLLETVKTRRKRPVQHPSRGVMGRGGVAQGLAHSKRYINT